MTEFDSNKQKLKDCSKELIQLERKHPFIFEYAQKLMYEALPDPLMQFYHEKFLSQARDEADWDDIDKILNDAL